MRTVFNLGWGYRLYAYLCSYTFLFPYQHPNTGLRCKDMKLVLFKLLNVHISHSEPNCQTFREWPLLSPTPSSPCLVLPALLPPTSAWAPALSGPHPHHRAQPHIGVRFTCRMSSFLNAGEIYLTRFKPLLV